MQPLQLIICISVNCVLLPTLVGSIAGVEHSAIGDSPSTQMLLSTPAHPQPEPQTLSVFREIDADHDGELEESEIKQWIHTGNSAFAQIREPNRATRSVLKSSALHDKGGDNILDKSVSGDDLQVYWKTLGHAMSVTEVVDWVSHAVQLPHLAPLFEEAAITGFDFPSLVENDGRALHDDVHVESKLHRRQLVRAITMKLFRLGAEPDVPRHLSAHARCASIHLTWTVPNDHNVAIHEYQLQRRNQSDLLVSAWRTVYSGSETAWTDPNVDEALHLEYRVRAWNLIGSSRWSQPLDVDYAPCGVFYFMFSAVVWQWIAQGGNLVYVLVSIGSVLYILASRNMPTGALTGCCRRTQSASKSGATGLHAVSSVPNAQPAISHSAGVCVVCGSDFAPLNVKHRCALCYALFHKSCGYATHRFGSCPVSVDLVTDKDCVCALCQHRVKAAVSS